LLCARARARAHAARGRGEFNAALRRASYACVITLTTLWIVHGAVTRAAPVISDRTDSAPVVVLLLLVVDGVVSV